MGIQFSFISYWVYQWSIAASTLAKQFCCKSCFSCCAWARMEGHCTLYGRCKMGRVMCHHSKLSLLLQPWQWEFSRNVHTTQFFRMHDMVKFMFFCGVINGLIMWKKRESLPHHNASLSNDISSKLELGFNTRLYQIGLRLHRLCYDVNPVPPSLADVLSR